MLRRWMRSDATTGLPRILLLDGGVSTHLEEERTAFSHRELWSSSLLLSNDNNKQDNHERIKRGHRDWLEIGKVNVLSTVTYQCHFCRDMWPSVLRQAADDGTATMRQMYTDAVRLARTAVQEYRHQQNDTSSRPHFVVASSGCYGAAMANGSEYTGDYGDASDECLRHFHRDKLNQILMQSSMPDAILVETVPSLRECKAIRDVLMQQQQEEESSANTPVTVALSCQNGTQLNDGSALVDAVKCFGGNVVEMIGLNCCDVRHLPEMVNVVKKYWGGALALYPNRGESWNAEKNEWEDDAILEDEWIDAMVNIVHLCGPRRQILVGGCCRTTPNMIGKLRTRLDSVFGCGE